METQRSQGRAGELASPLQSKNRGRAGHNILGKKTVPADFSPQHIGGYMSIEVTEHGKIMLFIMKSDRSLQAIGFDEYLVDGVLRNHNNIMVWKTEYIGTAPGMYCMLVEAAALGVDEKYLQHFINKCGADWFKAAVFMMVHFGELRRNGDLWAANALNERDNEKTGIHKTWLQAMADLCKRLGWKREKAIPQNQDFITLLRDRAKRNYSNR